MAKKEKPLFAAIPLQVIGNRALSAAHFQVLAAIAWHDQFGANGIGCYASLKRLAQETGLAQTTVSECTGDLEALGLLAKSRRPLNRRTKVYSLIYQGNPRILPETGNRPSNHGAEGIKVPGSGNDRGETLRVENSQTPEGIEQTDTQYIPRSGREKKKKPPPATTESPRRARALGAQARAAGDADSAFATEEKNARERENKKQEEADSSLLKEERYLAEAKKSREALASKAGTDPSEFDTLTWCAWLNLTCGYDRNAAAELIVRWRCDAQEDHDRVKRALCAAHTCMPPDIKAFMAERLKAPGS